MGGEETTDFGWATSILPHGAYRSDGKRGYFVSSNFINSFNPSNVSQVVGEY